MSDHLEDMGIGSYEYDWQNESRQEEIDRYQKKQLWRTGCGQLIKFNEMSNNHKKYCIKYCEEMGLISPNFDV